MSMVSDGVRNSLQAKLATVLSLVLMSLGAGHVALAQAPAYTDQTEIQKLLTAYEKSYDSGDYDGIAKLWPNLNGDKKEAKKLKERLSRPDISGDSQQKPNWPNLVPLP